MYLISYQKYRCQAKYPAGYFVGYPVQPNRIIQYPAFGLAGYPVGGRISGKNSIRCFPNKNYKYKNKGCAV
jgi:hypothetical protein